MFVGKKIATMLALAAFATSAWGETGITSGNMLKLRKKPTSDSVAIEAYPKGEKLEVIGKSANGKWLKVKMNNDRRVGYMFAAYVAIDEQAKSLVQQSEAPVIAFAKSAPEAGCTESMSEVGCAEFHAEEVKKSEPRKEKVVSLISPAGDGDSAGNYQARYEETLQQLTTARKEIVSLKQEVIKLKTDLAESEKTATEYKRRLASIEQVTDFRLMSLVELKGEEVEFNGLGSVTMAENDGRVIFKVPAELADRARRLFSKVNKNILDGAKVVYITIDKSRLETKKV